MINFLKKLFLSGFAIILFCIVPVSAKVETLPTANASNYEEIEVLENGDYITTTISENYSSIAFQATNTKTGSKTIVYRNSSSETLWSFKVSGTFSYNGSTSSCTKVSCSYSIENTAWKSSSTSVSKSKNTASGTITMKQYRLGLAINTITRTVTLTCDKNGNLS